MPTIMETNAGNNRPSNSWSERSVHVPGVRQIINTLTNAPHSFSQNGNRDEESANMLDWWKKVILPICDRARNHTEPEYRLLKSD